MRWSSFPAWSCWPCSASWAWRAPSRPVRGRGGAIRIGWGFLLAVSIAFNLGASLQNAGEQYFYHGELMTQLARFPEAIVDFSKVVVV